MKILCVCSGNTCRSPMLAGLLRAELAHRGLAAIQVESAGTSAHPGDRATPEAVASMAERGVDIAAHASRPVAAIDLDGFDRVLCMTSAHAAYMRSQGVPAAKLAVVDAEHGGVPDPYGGDRRDYEDCARVLQRAAAGVADTLAAAGAAPSATVAADPLAAARSAIEYAQSADPERRDGRPAEQVYGDRLEAWIAALVPDPSPALRLAARCQHLERWAIPRGEYPLDRVGYLAWRKAVHARQGRRASGLLNAAGCDPALAARVGALVAKAVPKGDPEGQALEDAACLVFLADELADFAAGHADYTREKFIDIIRKTWRKMSPRAHELALGIPLPAPLLELVKAAVAGG